MREYEIVLCEIKFYEAAAPIEILKQIRKLCIFGPAPLRRFCAFSKRACDLCGAKSEKRRFTNKIQRRSVLRREIQRRAIRDIKF